MQAQTVKLAASVADQTSPGSDDLRTAFRGQWSVRAAAVAGTIALTLLTGAAAKNYEANRSRLERMNPEQRRKIWEKYQQFLALPPAEQQRLRRLNADLDKLNPETRDRYRRVMERYKKWRDAQPLYERQLLDEAAAKGSTELYTALREVQTRQVTEDKLRRYWLLPERMRSAVPRVLAKLSPEEIEALDQMSPLDRTDRLFAHAQQLGMDMGGVGRPNRMRPRGPLPPPDPEKWRAFLERLPLSREQLEELSDLGAQRAIQRQRLLELYHEQHAQEPAKRPDSTTRKPGDRPPAKGTSEPTKPQTDKKSGSDKARPDPIGIPSKTP